MTSNFSLVCCEEVPALVIDDADLAEDVAGEILEHRVVEGGEDGAIALGDRDVLRAGGERDLGRDAAAELGDEGLRRLLDHVGVVHRQVAEVGRLLVGEVAHDADRAVAVDVEAHIGVGGHLRQIEAGVVGEARREMQIGGRVGLEEAERRIALEDLLRFGQAARVGGALVVVDREAGEAERRRDDEMRAERDDRRDDEAGSSAARPPGSERERRGRRRTTAAAARRSG